MGSGNGKRKGKGGGRKIEHTYFPNHLPFLKLHIIHIGLDTSIVT